MNIKPLILSLCLLVLTGCQPRNSSESRLRQRVNQYYEFVIKGDYGRTWDFIWHKARTIRNREEWTKLAANSEARSRLIAFEIKSAKSYPPIFGQVRIIFKSRNTLNGKVETEEGTEDWVYEQGD